MLCFELQLQFKKTHLFCRRIISLQVVNSFPKVSWYILIIVCRELACNYSVLLTPGSCYFHIWQTISQFINHEQLLKCFVQRNIATLRTE